MNIPNVLLSKKTNDIFKIISGNCQIKDLREHFIFRGISDYTYELKPSSLRKNSKLDEYILYEDMPKVAIKKIDALRRNYIEKNQFNHNNEKDLIYLNIDKNYEFDNAVQLKEPETINQLIVEKEISILMKFLDYADKCGLNVPNSKEIRKFIDNRHYFDEIKSWPKEEFYEVMALAQHYNSPTRFMDWSYDYKVSLYFAVKDILKFNEKDYKGKDGILWAFNYKLFNEWNHKKNKNEQFKLQFYRPEYIHNPNSNSQKGLFTFILDSTQYNDNLSFDEVIIKDFKENDKNLNDCYKNLSRTHMLYTSDIPNDEKVFYKFIIPEKLKGKILKELYIQGYSEEFLFPGYYSVSDNIKNRVILDEFNKKNKRNEK